METKTEKTGYEAAMKIADRLQANARKAENLATWREKTIALLNRRKAEGGISELALLKAAQAQRDAGVMEADEALCIFYSQAEWLAFESAHNDPELHDISLKIDATEKREGLADDEYWPRNDPDAPEDWKALQVKWEYRFHEMIAAVLRKSGEDEAAALFLNDNDAFHRRANAGWQLLSNRKESRGNTGSC